LTQNVAHRQPKLSEGDVANQPSNVVCSFERLTKPIHVVKVFQKGDSVTTRCFNLPNRKLDSCHHSIYFPCMSAIRFDP